jgi:hypothetical protein
MEHEDNFWYKYKQSRVIKPLDCLNRKFIKKLKAKKTIKKFTIS